MLHAIWMAETKVQANKAFDLFIATFQAKYPKAAECLTMVFKLVQSAARRWRALNGSSLLADVIAGVQFVDGVKQQAA